jgi:hypothetical protein
MNGKMYSFTIAIQNQLSFNKMLETQIQQTSGALPSQSNGLPSKDPIQGCVKSITTTFEGQAPESSESSLGIIEGNSKVSRHEIFLPMSEVSSDAILNRHWNQFSRPKVPSIQCVLGHLKVHYALYNWGTSVIILSQMVYVYLDEDSLVLVSRCLQLADSTWVQPYVLANDVLMEIWGSLTLVDFLVVDMDPHQQTSIILGAPFLESVKAKINEKKGIINIRVEGKHERFTFSPKHLAHLYQVQVHY